MNRMAELSRLTRQFQGIADRNIWARRRDNIQVTQPDGRRYNWRRLNSDSIEAQKGIKKMKASRK